MPRVNITLACTSGHFSKDRYLRQNAAVIEGKDAEYRLANAAFSEIFRGIQVHLNTPNLVCFFQTQLEYITCASLYCACPTKVLRHSRVSIRLEYLTSQVAYIAFQSCSTGLQATEHDCAEKS